MTNVERMTNSEALTKAGYAIDIDSSGGEVLAFDIRASFVIRHSRQVRRVHHDAPNDNG
ncbi:MAG: hypothetical protein IID44_29070 [Planctomycetes bacterium]|nr:hypothetical protein [Planctomycetota bacterium]